jgi:lipopolysaccharide export system ATP-binding protein
MHKLKVQKLKKFIKKNEIIKDVSLEVKSGQIVGLLGPNGAGKTTSFYMICGLIEPSSGEIYLDNQKITHLPMHKRAKVGIGYLPQESSIFKELSVEENIKLAVEVAYKDKKSIKKRVEELLELLNIEPIRDRAGVSLSGGERRRCEIARALAIKPRFLLLDEPFAGIDPIVVNEIQGILKDLASIDIGILITDHNVRETLSICDRAYVIKDGSILVKGSSEEIFRNKDVKRYYLGDSFKL